MSKDLKHWLFQALKIILAVAIIVWLVSSGKLNFKALQKLFTWQLGLPALLLVFFNYFFASERWRLLLKTQNIDGSSWSIFKLSLIGGFFNYAMPGGVGGDVVKAYYFAKDHQGTRVVAVTSVLMDRVLGLYSMIMMALVVMFYDLQHVMAVPALHSLFYFVCLLFVACTVGLLLVFSPVVYQKGFLRKLLLKLPLSAKTLKLYESMHLYGNKGRTILGVIFISFLAQICSILFLAIAGNAAGISVPIQTYFLVAPLGFMAIAIPISPAGVGIGQAAFYFLFNLYTGQKTDLGPTVITAFQVASLFLCLIGAYYYLRRKDRATLKTELEGKT
jgi:uncharacterized protein (TIRG00374 family)